MINAIIKWFAGVIVGGLNVLWGLLAATAFTTPDVTVLNEVKSIASTSLAVVNSVYILAILWMAILVLGRDTIQSRYGLSELIPRLIIGLITANLAMPLCSQLIGLANAVTAALTSQNITSPGSMKQMQQLVAASLGSDPSGNNPAGFLLLLIGLVLAVMVGMLLMQWIVRIGILIIAVGVAPIALALHGTPHTEPAAKLWWRTMFGALATVLIQAVALHTTLTVFLSPNADLPLLGLPGNPGATMKLMVVMCLLWSLLKVPAMMRRYVSKSSPSSVGTIVRVMLVQQLTRGLSRAAGGGRAARTAAAAGRRPGGGPAAGRADSPWPTGPTRGGGGGSRPTRRPGTGPLPPAERTSPSSLRPAQPARSSRPARVPSRSPAGAGPGVVGTAYPSGRPVRPYTRDEIAGGVDVYTQSLRRRAAATPGRASAANRSNPSSRGSAAPTGRTRT
jgi:TrbL/VirB6 plasmid conjugal transfer protein